MSPDPTLSQLLSFPPHPPPQHPLPSRQYESGAKGVLKSLEALPPVKLTGPISGKDSLLDIIDPGINSIPYLYSLVAHAKANHGSIFPGTALWENMIKFVTSFDTVQIRYCGTAFREMTEMTQKGCSKNPTAAIEPIATALLRLDPSSSTLTSIHLKFIETCLRERAFSLALPILDKDIYHLPGPVGTEYGYPSAVCDPGATSSNYINVKSGFTEQLAYQDFLRYFLYGASIYIASKQWRRALEFLEIVLTAPVAANAISMIQVEAYKRWTLVSILVHGRPARPPRNMTQFASKHCHNVARAYAALGAVFNELDTKRLQAEIEVGPFKADCNYSLALLVLDAHYRFAISSLSRTYARLPVKFIPKLISRPNDSVEDTESYIKELIASKQLRARLTQAADSSEIILEFTAPSTTETSEEELLAEQMTQKQRILVLRERMLEAKRRIELSKEYVIAAKKQRRLEAAREKGGREEDEDMLVDEL